MNAVAWGQEQDDEYVVRKGDVLELLVAGIPALNRRAMVDFNGEVSLPLVGTVPADGSGLADVRQRIKRELASRPFRQISSEGLENLLRIDEAQVTVDIAEYRPVFVRGDVSKPGQLPYRPGLTARQIIALAGGYDVVRFRVENPFLEAADLRARYETLLTDFARTQAQIQLLQRELRDEQDPGGDATVSAPLPRKTLNRIAALESQRIEQERKGYLAAREHLEGELRHLDAQLGEMQKVRQSINTSAEAQRKDLTQLRDLTSRGLSPSNRLATEERLAVASLDRMIVATSEVSAIQRNREATLRQIAQINADHQKSLLGSLSDAEVRLSTLRSNLQATSERLMYVGILKSQLVRGTGGTPDLRIFREQAGKLVEIHAAEDTPLRSGDVLEVYLKSERAEDLAWP